MISPARPRRHKTKQRPENFFLDYSHFLAKGLVFAGLGNVPKGIKYCDSSIQQNHGTLTNFAWPNTSTSGWQYVPQLGRMGLACDAVNDKVVLPAISGTGNLSISLWIQLTTASTEQVFINLGGVTHDFAQGYLYNSHFYFEASARQDGTWIDSPSRVIASGSLHHFVGEKIEGYPTGVWVDGVKSGNPSGAYESEFLTTYGFGRVVESGLGFAGGLFSDVLIWNRPLSPAEINILANPSDPMLGGLLLPLWPRVFAAAVAGGGITVPVLRHHYEQQGVC